MSSAATAIAHSGPSCSSSVTQQRVSLELGPGPTFQSVPTSGPSAFACWPHRAWVALCLNPGLCFLPALKCSGMLCALPSHVPSFRGPPVPGFVAWGTLGAAPPWIRKLCLPAASTPALVDLRWWCEACAHVAPVRRGVRPLLGSPPLSCGRVPLPHASLGPWMAGLPSLWSEGLVVPLRLSRLLGVAAPRPAGHCRPAFCPASAVRGHPLGPLRFLGQRAVHFSVVGRSPLNVRRPFQSHLKTL